MRGFLHYGRDDAVVRGVQSPGFGKLDGAEVAARHLVGLVEVEQGEHGGRDDSQADAFAQSGFVACFRDVEERDGVGGVGGVGASGDGVDEHLGIAVVGGDQEAAAALLDGLVDAA